MPRTKKTNVAAAPQPATNRPTRGRPRKSKLPEFTAPVPAADVVIDIQPEPEPEPPEPTPPALVVPLIEQIVEAHQPEAPALVLPEPEPVRYFQFDPAPATVEELVIENAQLRAAIRNLEAELALHKAKVRTPKAPGAKPAANRSESAKRSWETIRANREAAKLAAAK